MLYDFKYQTTRNKSLDLKAFFFLLLCVPALIVFFSLTQLHRSLRDFKVLLTEWHTMALQEEVI